MSNKNIRVYREPYSTKKFIEYVENTPIDSDYFTTVKMWFLRAKNRVPDAPEESYIYHIIVERIITEKIFEDSFYEINYLIALRDNISTEDFFALLEAMSTLSHPSPYIRNALIYINLDINVALGEYINIFSADDLAKLWDQRPDSREVILTYIIINNKFNEFMDSLMWWNVKDIYAAVPNLPNELKLGIAI